jgi:hypothetical protein
VAPAADGWDAADPTEATDAVDTIDGAETDCSSAANEERLALDWIDAKDGTDV